MKRIKTLKSLALTVLFGMTVLSTLMFTGCPQKSGSKPTPAVTKYKVDFSVDGKNGSLTAKVDGKEIKTGAEVEKDKTVVFTATPATGYQVKGWTLDGIAVNGTNSTYSLKITKAVTVKVNFESSTPTPPPDPVNKYKVTIEQTQGGIVTATPELPLDGMVAENTEITFSAKNKDDYLFIDWECNVPYVNIPGQNNACKVKITQSTNIKAKFGKPFIYVAGTIGSSGNKKPYYWKDSFAQEISLEAGTNSAKVNSITLKDGKPYIAGIQNTAACVWKESNLYWKGAVRTEANAVLTDNSKLYVAGSFKKDTKSTAGIADITNPSSPLIACLRTPTETETGSYVTHFCASPSAFYAVGEIYDSKPPKIKAVLWTIDKELNEASRTETDLGTMIPYAVCHMDGITYVSGRKDNKSIVWEITGTGSSAIITEIELKIGGTMSVPKALCKGKDKKLFAGGSHAGRKPAIWEGRRTSQGTTYFAEPKALSPESGCVNALYALDGDIYAAGFIDTPKGKKLVYWKFKGSIFPEPIILSDTEGETTGIFVTK